MDFVKIAAEAVPEESFEIPDAAGSISRFEQFVQDIWNGFTSAVPTILIAIVILIIGIIVSKVTLKLMEKAMDRSKLDLTVNRFIKSAVKIVLYVLVITIVLTVLGVPMTSIITVIGTAGVAVGLALQSSLSNLAGGFLILFAKPFRVGSYIKCGGEEGTVESITILYTKLLTVDNKAIYIPNGTAANAVVTNFSDMPTRRVDLSFSISYNEDYDRAVKAIETAISGSKLILREAESEPFIRMGEPGESSIAITVRLWTKTDDYWTVYFDTLEAVRREFIKENIEIPYNQLDVHVVNR